MSEENIIPIPVRQCDTEDPYYYNYGTEPEGTTHTFRLENISATGVYYDTVSIAGQCRTIYVLDFTIDPTYNDTLPLLNYCVNNLPYPWEVSDTKNGTKTIAIHIPDNVTLPFDTLCSTTLKTIHSCDSVVNLPLRIQPIHKTPIYDTICESSLPYEWKDAKATVLQTITVNDIKNSASWKQPDWTYETSYIHHSVYGCDSTLQLHLTVYPILYKDTAIQLCPEQLPYTYCENGKQLPVGYKGGTITETIESKQFPIACDSVITYTISVSEVDKRVVFDSICDNDLPYNFEYPSDGIESQPLEKQRLIELYHDTVAFDTMRHEGHCLHIVELHLKVNPTYETTHDLVELCQGQKTYEWRREGEHDIHRGELIKEIQLPISGGNPDEDFLYYHMYDTTLSANVTGCDSTLHLPLIIYRTYFNADTASISDKEDFTWIKNRQDTTVYGVNNPDKPSSIEGLEPRKEYYLYRDSLLSIHGCDSVHYQYIYVRPTFTVWDSAYVCQDRDNNYQWIEHEDSQHLFNGSGQNITTIPLDPAGEFIYFDSLKTVAGDDSIFGLYLMIHPTYYIPVQRTDTHICDNHRYHFHTAYFDTVYNTDGNLKRVDETLYYFDIEKTDSTIHGCDSAVWHRVFVHPTYYREKEDSVCQTSPYVWEGHASTDGHANSWIWDAQQQVRIGRDDIPTNVEAGVYTYVDSLRTKTCEDCPDSGCDSVWVLKLRVDSIYARYDTITMSDEETRKWQHTVYIGSKVRVDTLDSSWFDGEDSRQIVRIPDGKIINDFDTVYPTIHKCDSSFFLHLLVGPTFRDTIEGWTCDNEPYHWFHAGDSTKEALANVEILKPRLYYDSLRTVGFGFDSIYVLNLHNYPTYNVLDYDTICQGSPYSWKDHTESDRFYSVEAGKWISREAIPTDVAGHFTYIDSLKTHEPESHPDQNRHSGCDSVWTLHLYIPPVYHIPETKSLCESDSLSWQGILYLGQEFNNYHPDGYDDSKYRRVQEGVAYENYENGILTDTAQYYTTKYSCDSVYHLNLQIYRIYRDTIERRSCQTQDGYLYEHLNNGEGGILPALHLSDSLTRNDTLQTIFDCDSIITLHYYVDSVYHFSRPWVECQAYDSIWTWYEEGIPQKTVSLNIGDTTYHLGTEYKTIHDCDSTRGLELYVAPIYHFYDTLTLCENDSLSWQGILYLGREFDNYHPGGYDASYYRRVQNALIGRDTYYSDTAQYYTTKYDCDSVYHLALKVNPVYRITVVDSICQTEDGYPYDNLNNGAGGILPARYLSDSLTRNDTLSTIAGCDSIITLHLRVDSVYDYRPYFEFCQDTINTDTVTEWTDDSGKTRTFTLDISKPGTFTHVEEYKSIHNCDSIYGVTFIVHPIYRFDTIIHMCEDERVVWQDTLYTGDSVRIITQEDSVILAPGTYHRFKHFTTVAGCDSDYYATIYIHAIYDTLRYVSVCESDGFVWYQEDHPLGVSHYYKDTIVPIAYCDTIKLLPYEADLPQSQRDTTMRYAERMLQTIHGCDSLSRIWVTVKPTYFFMSDTTICANDHVKYRGKFFSSKDTVYTDRFLTADGCDSIYQLRLHVRPIFIHTRRETICDNETLYHTSLNGLEVVWKPGNEVRDSIYEYYDMVYEDKNGCDSIYRYYITIHPSYQFMDTMTLCSADTVLLQGDHYVGERIEYPTDTFVLPYDVYYADTFMTRLGCDSIYGISATIYPAYRHIDYITICDDGEADWRAHHYEGSMIGNTFGSGLPAGQYTFYDSLTTIHNCDSIYELRLTVTPTYLFEETVTKCADDDMTWHGHILDHLPVGDHFFYDSTTTVIYGCDSVYHLYLTVVDTTFEVRYDTICRTESYNLHGVYLMEPGSYKDTTLNDWGCHHFTYLHLEVIEPTVPTAWADSICADDDAYELFYRYTGRDPIAFSVYYNDFGHQYGFEDQIDIPITTTEELAVLTIPMPFRDGDKRKYPRPDHYPIKLVLDNGICTNPDLCSTDTSIVLNYPSWVTEQRFRDVIAILSEKYNGGYTFSHYQWYRNGEPIPGEALPYLYIPRELDRDTVEYYVRLIREGETESYQTCPIRIYDDFGTDTIAPYMGYLSVVPTCVSTGNPVISILSRHKGTYNIGSVTGKLITSGSFTPDVTEVRLPAQEGIYIVHLWSDETPEEPERTIKVQMVSGDRLW